MPAPRSRVLMQARPAPYNEWGTAPLEWEEPWEGRMGGAMGEAVMRGPMQMQAPAFGMAPFGPEGPWEEPWFEGFEGGGFEPWEHMGVDGYPDMDWSYPYQRQERQERRGAPWERRWSGGGTGGSPRSGGGTGGSPSAWQSRGMSR